MFITILKSAPNLITPWLKCHDEKEISHSHMAISPPIPCTPPKPGVALQFLSISYLDYHINSSSLQTPILYTPVLHKEREPERKFWCSALFSISLLNFQMLSFRIQKCGPICNTLKIMWWHSHPSSHYQLNFLPFRAKPLSFSNHQLILHCTTSTGLEHNPAVLLKILHEFPVTEECPNPLTQQRSHFMIWPLLTFPVGSHHSTIHQPYATHKPNSPRKDQYVWHLYALLLYHSHICFSL